MPVSNVSISISNFFKRLDRDNENESDIPESSDGFPVRNRIRTIHSMYGIMGYFSSCRSISMGTLGFFCFVF